MSGLHHKPRAKSKGEPHDDKNLIEVVINDDHIEGRPPAVEIPHGRDLVEVPRHGRKTLPKETVNFPGAFSCGEQLEFLFLEVVEAVVHLADARVFEYGLVVHQEFDLKSRVVLWFSSGSALVVRGDLYWIGDCFFFYRSIIQDGKKVYE